MIYESHCITGKAPGSPEDLRRYKQRAIRAERKLALYEALDFKLSLLRILFLVVLGAALGWAL